MLKWQQKAYYFHLVKSDIFVNFFQVLKNDHLPNNICSKCISKVRVAYDFKSQCERAFEMLLSVMETYNLGVKADNHVIPAELVLVDSQNVKEEIDNFYPNSNDQEGFNSANTEYGTVGTAQLIVSIVYVANVEFIANSVFQLNRKRLRQRELPNTSVQHAQKFFQKKSI